MGEIYMILNNVNGKVYIGQALNSKRRLYKHKYDLRRGKHSNPHLQSAWNKYGESSFTFMVVEKCDDDYLDFAERSWIKSCDSTNRKKGYNLEEGGTNGYKVLEETKQKISAKNSGKNNPFYGKKHSAESRKRMSESRSGEKNYWHSSNLTDEKREKLSERFKGEKNPQWGKSIIDEYGGVWFVKTMASTGITRQEFCRYLGIDKITLYRYLKRRGHTWSSLKQ